MEAAQAPVNTQRVQVLAGSRATLELLPTIKPLLAGGDRPTESGRELGLLVCQQRVVHCSRKGTAIRTRVYCAQGVVLDLYTAVLPLFLHFQHAVKAVSSQFLAECVTYHINLTDRWKTSTIVDLKKEFSIFIVLLTVPWPTFCNMVLKMDSNVKKHLLKW